MLRFFGKRYPIRKLILILWEGIFLFLTILVLTSVTAGEVPSLKNPVEFVRITTIVITCILSLYYFGLYTFSPTEGLKEMTVRLLQALGSASIFLGLLYMLFPAILPNKWVFFAEILLFITMSSAWRFGYLYLVKKQITGKPVVIVGQGRFPLDIMEELKNLPDSGYRIKAVIVQSDEDARLYKNMNPVEVVTGFHDLFQKIRSIDAEEIIVAMDERRGNMPIKQLIDCRMQGIEVTEGETFISFTLGKIMVDKINPSWLIFKEGFQKSRMTMLGKRIIGSAVSLSGLLMTLPVTIPVAILIKLESEGPIFYKQERVGKDGRIFQVIKFRSMTADAEKHGAQWAQQNDPRVTKVGQVIRKLRIDEIPQMWNVLKGEMSFVGPRPERPQFVKELSEQIPYYDQRHTVHPGLTGWAQINYPYGSSVEDAKKKLEYDLYYIKHMSIWLDLFIILKTVKTILFREGAR